MASASLSKVATSVGHRAVASTILSDRTFVEYFAGVGLVRLGLESCGWRVLLANDIDPKKQQVYCRHFQDAHDGLYLVQDIHTLQAIEIPSSTLATASFPCIDLSLAGNQAGLNGKHSSAFWGFIRILEQMSERRPPIVLIENVVGWLNSSRGQDFRDSVSALNSLGYACDAFLLNASHFTPQSRPRLFVVGAKHTPPTACDAYDLLSRSPLLAPKPLMQAIAHNRDLKWMILPLPEPPPPVRGLHSIVEHLPEDDPTWWPAPKLHHLLAQMSPAHRAAADCMKNTPNLCFATVYKRIRAGTTRAELRADGLAGCLRTPVGGSSKQILIQAGRGILKARWMTAREYARLQGVPDAYPIDVPYLQALWGFGDAVCVPAISWIATHALNPLVEGLQALG